MKSSLNASVGNAEEKSNTQSNTDKVFLKKSLIKQINVLKLDLLAYALLKF